MTVNWERIMNEWVPALLSGNYEQATNVLRDTTESTPKHCCLGVLCDVFNPDGWTDERVVAKDIGLYVYTNKHARDLKTSGVYFITDDNFDKWDVSDLIDAQTWGPNESFGLPDVVQEAYGIPSSNGAIHRIVIHFDNDDDTTPPELRGRHHTSLTEMNDTNASSFTDIANVLTYMYEHQDVWEFYDPCVRDDTERLWREYDFSKQKTPENRGI